MTPEFKSPWKVVTPATWPKVPREMTVTTLTEIEECPRKWSLRTADYPELWDGRGYPPRFQVNTLAGTVVHLALETITTALVRARCPSVDDAAAPQVLKALGGYTKVVHICIDRVLERFARNPRASGILEYATRSLRALVSDLRSQTQAMLCRVRLPEVVPAQQRTTTSGSRAPLGLGAFTEVELHAFEIGWKGNADLIVISPASCEITDFKTGTKEESHRFQLDVYALLWSLDTALNPEGRLADRLILRYANSDLMLPAPTEGKLRELREELVARRDAAHHAVARIPPEARPHKDACRYCNVRHLCDQYWTVDVQLQMKEDSAPRKFSDVEVTVVGRHGPLSWDVLIEVTQIAVKEKAAILRMTENTELRKGSRLRILDAGVAIDAENPGPAIVTIGTLSEVYTVG